MAWYFSVNALLHPGQRWFSATTNRIAYVNRQKINKITFGPNVAVTASSSGDRGCDADAKSGWSYWEQRCSPSVACVWVAQAPDDANRGVARISLMDGQVSVKRGDAGEWVAGVINAPLMTGDHISTAPNSRAEVEIDSANVLRIGGTPR